jgi:thioredoxin-like negative regulator of GroEL
MEVPRARERQTCRFEALHSGHILVMSARSTGAAGDLPTLVFVGSRSCGASRRMESLVAWIRVTNKRHLRVVDLDVDRSSELASRLGVRSTPTLLVLRGGSIVNRLEGRATGRQIEELVRPYVQEAEAGEAAARRSA